MLRTGKEKETSFATEEVMSFGVLLNNKLISKLHQDKELILTPWNPENLQVAQYALNPSEIIYEDSGGREQRHRLADSDYLFQPNEYAKVMVEQRIILPEGIVGRFIAASGLIEAGFGITVGKLDPKYGQENETIQFGIKNLKNKANNFSRRGKFTNRVAYIEFFDIRNLPIEPAEVSEYDYNVRSKRRFRDLMVAEGLPGEQ